MVVGVGLNLRLPSGGFPPELPDAGALLQSGAAGPSFAKAAAALLEALYALLSVAPDRRFLSEYCERSALTSKSLLVLQATGSVRPPPLASRTRRTARRIPGRNPGNASQRGDRHP
jgi:biotin-(acetyl-CoA carboxylase) ligase